MNRQRAAAGFWLALVLLSLGAGVLLSASSLLTFSQLKPLVDALAADGQVESYSFQRHIQLRLPVGLVGLSLLAIGITLIVLHERMQALLSRMLACIYAVLARLGKDFRQLFHDLTRQFSDKKFTAGLIAIILIAAGVRIAFLASPVSYDEAYTFVVFAIRPVSFITTDYHVPNNHILHTLLVRAAYLLFGSELWAVRLPVFIAGVLLVPVVYLVGKAFFERYTALLSAALVASAWVLIEYSANARGYMLVSLFGLAVLGLAAYLKIKGNLAAWFLLVLFSVLGFYTVPIFLYPFGMVFAWLLCSALATDIPENQNRWRFIRAMIVAGAAIAVLTLLLYLPVFRVSGVAAVTSNRFVSPEKGAAFVEGILARFHNSWLEWTHDWPGAAGPLMLLGMLLSTIFNRRLSSQRVPFLIPAALWIVLVLAIQRVTPWPRVWLFLLPFVLIWTAAGLVGIFRLLHFPRWRISFKETAYIVAVIGIAVALSWSVYQAQDFKASSNADLDEVAVFFQHTLKPGDAVASAIPVNYPLRYYFFSHGVPLSYFYMKTSLGNNATAATPEIQRALVVVNPAEGQTLEKVVEITRLEDILGEAVPPRLVHQTGSTRVFEFDLKP